MSAPMDDILKHVIPSASLTGKGGVCAVGNDAVEIVLQDFLCRETLGKGLTDHILKSCQYGQATSRLSIKLSNEAAFMTPIANFVQREATEGIPESKGAPAFQKHWKTLKQSQKSRKNQEKCM